MKNATNILFFMSFGYVLLFAFQQKFTPIFYQAGYIMGYIQTPLNLFSTYIVPVQSYVFSLFNVLIFVLLFVMIKKVFFRSGN